MKVNFTLSLSFDGITLLSRQGDGWAELGQVSVDDPMLGDKLASLRGTAQGGSDGALAVKLHLPNEQIKFMALDSAQTSDADVQAAVQDATPYSIDDLVIDFERGGGRTHIAAVAKETLAEAEDFAIQHGFMPICFVATAEPLTFGTEVHFGATKAANGQGAAITKEAPLKIVAQPATEPVVEPAPMFTPRSRRSSDTPTAEEAAFAEDRAALLTPDTEDQQVLFTRRLSPTNEADTAVMAPHVAPVARPVSVEEASKPAPALDASAPMPNVAEIKAPAAETSPDRSTSLRAPQRAKRVEPALAAPNVRGRPKYLGLMLTVGLVIALILVALWANTLSDDGIAGLLERDSDLVEAAPVTVETSALPEEVVTAPVQVLPPAEDTDVAVTLPEQTLPIVTAPTGRVLSPAEADRIYAATGVYQRAPRLPITPREATIEDLAPLRVVERTAVPGQPTFPDQALMAVDASIDAPALPPPPGTRYLRDLKGFILAMPDGVVTPSGALLFAGAPSVLPPARPGTEPPSPAEQAVATPVDEGQSIRLIGGRPPILPPLRPEGLAPEVEENPLEAQDIALPLEDEVGTEDETITALVEDVTLSLDEATEAVAFVVTDGRPDILPPLRPASFVELTPPAEQVDDSDVLVAADPALAGFRPTARPADLVSDAVLAALSTNETGTDALQTDVTAVAAAIAAAAPSANFEDVTALAVPSSIRPDPRPRNFSQVVARAEAASARQGARSTSSSSTSLASAPAVASGPIPGGVARAATIDNAIRLRDLSLVGVYGRASERRALVRLSNGRFLKVEIGSNLDGGRVTAIGESTVNYVKGGRTFSLEMPSG